jgi:hypothetical protein
MKGGVVKTKIIFFTPKPWEPLIESFVAETGF